MRILPICLALLAGAPLAAVAGAQPAAAPAAARQRILGADLTLEPPPGWTPAPEYTGFENEAVSGVFMVATVPLPWAQARTGLSREALASRGVEIVVHDDNAGVGNASAIRAEFIQDREGTRMRTFVVAFAATPTVTAMVNASLAESAPAAAVEALRSSLESLRWEPRQNVDPFEAFPFTLDMPQGLKPATGIINTLLLTSDAAGGVNPLQDAILLAGRRPQAAPMEEEQDRRDYALKAVNLGQMLRMRGDARLEEIRVDGLDGYEVGATMEAPNGETVLVNVLVLFDGASTWEIVASVPASKRGGASIETLTAAARSFRRKEEPAKKP